MPSDLHSAACEPAIRLVAVPQSETLQHVRVLGQHGVGGTQHRYVAASEWALAPGVAIDDPAPVGKELAQAQAHRLGPHLVLPGPGGLLESHDFQGSQQSVFALRC